MKNRQYATWSIAHNVWTTLMPLCFLVFFFFFLDISDDYKLWWHKQVIHNNFTEIYFFVINFSTATGTHEGEKTTAEFS